MKLTNPGPIQVYTLTPTNPLPSWHLGPNRRKRPPPHTHDSLLLLQDFTFPEAGLCIRPSPDGNNLISTGTYKPQIHVHHLPDQSLSFSRHTNDVNVSFVLIAEDGSKSVHLQGDRWVEVHNLMGRVGRVRVPRYGRDLGVDWRAAEVLVPTVGVGPTGAGEVFRLNLELGRFVTPYGVDVGDGDGGALQGGVHAGAVNCVDVAEMSHGLLAFGTSIGSVELWDSRCRVKAAVLGVFDGAETTAVRFHELGLGLATGGSNGVVQTYDLRSPRPVLRKEHGDGERIKGLRFLGQRYGGTGDLLLSMDKSAIKIWDATNGDFWTSVEPDVDLNHVEWIPDTGMLVAANEGVQQHAFFIPQLGPAPKWCAYLDHRVEEMAEDAEDPNAFVPDKRVGEIYDNYVFLDMEQLRELQLDTLLGQKNSKLRPYMHGCFVPKDTYEVAKMTMNPVEGEEQRRKARLEKLEKERNSRVRGKKKTDEKDAQTLDPRFHAMLNNAEFAIDKSSREYQLLNPSSAQPKRAVESSDDEDEEDRYVHNKPSEVGDGNRIGTTSYKTSGKAVRIVPKRSAPGKRSKSFGELASTLPRHNAKQTTTNIVGDKEITFEPSSRKKQKQHTDGVKRPQKDRRSASKNTLRGL
ncbi:hypothetical protein K470DRAFT_216855 [Piedraia hortae CBS 480.64]|uniref:Uncharacterized protein n=1 Tax=Piedraia hortae CBS 480.64 TaxID=1314780 RepID=A0A6A7C0R6_9PEZI|nr:hypothetical protein K470DRAFT_216855 [Piedraia hortae CBS 480.64]